MKRLILLTTLLLSTSAYALENCPSDTSARWHNCFGSLTLESGSKYVGEWKDDKRHGQGTYTFGTGKWEGDKYVGEWKDDKKHGQGTYTFAGGTIERGYYSNGEYVPDICEGMGLTKGTEAFGSCVVETIKTID